MTDFDYDVAIVGIGPVGGVLANLLGLQQVRTVAIDRSPQPVQLPRGVGFDAEMMRVAQTVGVAEALEPRIQIFPGAQYLDADGKLVATRPALTGPGTQGWADRYHMHQPDFEEVFRDGMAQYPSLELRLGYEVDDVANSPAGGAVVTMTDIATGQPSTVTARYVVGCDGARSLVRRAAHTRFDDFGLNQPWVVVDLEINERADVPKIVTHYADPQCPVIYLPVVRNVIRYEFCAAPDEDLDKATEPAAVWERVARWVKPDQATLLRAAVYTHRSLVAQNWRDGALIVAGDAAHQTPPFMGQGLCAGVRDAASLAWRLGAIVNDGAPDALIDGYAAERSAHARFVIQAATALGQVYTQPSKEKLEAINASVGREGRGQQPRLGAGLWQDGGADGTAGPGGTLAPQPRLADGRLIDDVAGYRFAVIGTAATLAGLSENAQKLANDSGLRLIEATGPAADWLTGLGAQAVILRPDRYYYGTFHDAAALGEAIGTIAHALAPA